MELLVVVLIIAIIGAVVYPSIRRGMDSVQYQRDLQNVALFFKRALVHSRLDGKARTIRISDEGDALVCEERRLVPFSGKQKLDTLLLNGTPVEEITIVPYRFFVAGVRFENLTVSVDLFTGEVEEEHAQ